MTLFRRPNPTTVQGILSFIKKDNNNQIKYKFIPLQNGTNRLFNRHPVRPYFLMNKKLHK